MGKGERRRHIQFAADDLNIRTGFTRACRFHRVIELAERDHARRKPVGAAKRLRQFRIFPGCEVVVGPIRVLLQRPLDQISFIIENKEMTFVPNRPIAPISFAVS